MIKPVDDTEWKETITNQESLIKKSANIYHILIYTSNSDEIKNEKRMQNTVVLRTSSGAYLSNSDKYEK